MVNTGLKCSANSYRCEIQKNRRVERRDKLCLEKLKKSCRVEEEVNGRERKFAKGLKKGIKLNELECILASMRDEIQKINESFSGEGGWILLKIKYWKIEERVLTIVEFSLW